MEEKIQLLLKKIEKLDKDHHFSQISPEVGQMLYTLVIDSKARSILELGTSAAYSTIWLGAATKENNGTVYTIEKDKRKVAFAKKHITESGLQNIQLIEGDIFEVLESWNKEIDFLFIDAEKSKYAQYLKKVESSLKQESIVVADNIKTIHKGKTNIEEKTKEYTSYVNGEKYNTVFLDIGEGLLISRKC